MYTGKIKCFVKRHYSNIMKIDLYTGYVTVYDYNGKYLYSKYTGITRIDCGDAMIDAKILMDNIFAENNIFEKQVL
jgi:hypothetical protein